MLSGIGSTWFVPETKDKSLEDISNEEQSNFIFGACGNSFTLGLGLILVA